MLLLPELLPQPDQQRCQPQHVQYGRVAMDRIHADLQQAFQTSLEEDFGAEPFGTPEVMSLLSPLNGLAIEIMTVLESGGDTFPSDDEANESMPDAGTGGLAPVLPGETQTTRAPGSASSSAGLEGEDRADRVAREDEEHVLLERGHPHKIKPKKQNYKGCTNLTDDTGKGENCVNLTDNKGKGKGCEQKGCGAKIEG